MDLNIQEVVAEMVAGQIDQQPICALSDLQLALVGGGSGDVVFA